MDCVKDPVWWWLFLVACLLLAAGGGLSLEDLLRKPKSAPLKKLAPLRTVCLLAFTVILIFVLRLYGIPAALSTLLVASILCMIVMASRMDWKGLQAAQWVQILEQERHRDDVKKFWAEKLRKNPEIAPLMTSLRVEEEDLDDYFELIACGWTAEQLLRVVQDPRVFEYFFTHQEQSKWEILNIVREIHQAPRKPAEKPSLPHRKRNTR